MTFAAATFLFFSAVAAASFGPSGELAIVNRDIAPDGFSRPTVLAGGSFPGPLLTGHTGDTFDVNVIDQLTDGRMNKTVSVHWHGFPQRGTAWADGTSSVTQCPISPGHAFRYKFKTEEHGGTYWYHSHLGTQYCDGLRGPIVVYDRNDPHKSLYDVDDASTVITLADWYHFPSNTAPPGPVLLDSVLINGKGRYPGGPKVDLAVISVQRGKRYRMRLVSTSCDSNFQFTIDGHSMTVIEADSISVKPVKVDSIQIFAGQRYSFVLNANAQVGNYWVRSKPNLNETLQTFDGGINSAILRYIGAPASEPTTTQTPSTLPLVETNLKPLDNCALGKPGVDGADQNINLDIELANTPAGPMFTMNGHAYTPPSMPDLLQILSGAKRAQDILPSGTVIGVPRNKVIQVTIPAAMANGEVLPGAPHPIHMHGHSFAVVRSAGNATYNFVDPPKRDVVNLGDKADDKVTIRFKTDNPGPWALHCHIDWHLKLGFAVIFAEDIEGIPQAVTPPQEWKELCPIYSALSPSDL